MFGKATPEKLMQLGAKGKLEKLRKYLEDKDANVRAAAARAIGQIDTDEGANTLILMLRDPSIQVQTAVAEALGETSYQAGAEHLRRLYRTTDDEALKEICLRGAHSIDSRQ